MLSFCLAEPIVSFLCAKLLWFLLLSLSGCQRRCGVSNRSPNALPSRALAITPAAAALIGAPVSAPAVSLLDCYIQTWKTLFQSG
ncbi:hypothetical protein AMECASPLE_027698 [Ameca splendens]|uniref:Secreted protein n=1 Tax=Ameca splendens TaxID=208324 RepID=A0ABV0YT50_9TELE